MHKVLFPYPSSSSRSHEDVSVQGRTEVQQLPGAHPIVVMIRPSATTRHSGPRANSMKLLTSKIGVTNNREVPHVIHVEPWAHDFTLLPGQALEVVAYGDQAAPWFELAQWENSSQIYCNGASTFEVMQDEVELKCGHNRQPLSH